MLRLVFSFIEIKMKKKGKKVKKFISKRVEPYHENVGPLVTVIISKDGDPLDKDMAVSFSSPKNNNNNPLH